jgi:hypothetical protein
MKVQARAAATIRAQKLDLPGSPVRPGVPLSHFNRDETRDASRDQTPLLRATYGRAT